ncbi:MAG TPA: leishmanolysin-related zinc metalloendopeptidase [Gemmatimonadales bacterium]|nr:leishmanolysin-related zinc metalloendopeptidase [Gemmatimonadales bacterium]
MLTPAAGTALSGFYGNYLAGAPAVRVTDKQGQPLAGVAVSFAATGGGQLTGAQATSDSAGHASLTSWRLGASGAQQVTATTSDAAPLSFTAAATAPPASTFRIEVRYASGTVPTAAQAAAFDSAAARWTRIILKGGDPYPIHEVSPGCGDLTGETVDGVVITAELKDLDGAGQILGSAGPCILRDADYLPAQGIMQFDTADLAVLEARGQLRDVILHEMGHVLGFGTVWDLLPIGQPTQSLLLRSPPTDPVFTGLTSRAALYGLAGVNGFAGTPVPVENTGGQGTIFSHWREATFGSELMTGWLNPGLNPLSALTIAQFKDLGYQVNDALGENIGVAALLQAAGQAPLPLIEGQLTMPLLVIDRSGHAVRRVPRVFK